jgi:16S rRNA (cytosine1402-N4)-methyltransferase
MTDRDAVPQSPSAHHIPVLLREAVRFLAPRDGGLYIDATFGAGGYAAAILAAADTRVIGIDRDPAAIAEGRTQERAAGGRLVLAQAEFAALDTVAADLAVAEVDGIVLDIGVSSMQLDIPDRGFSFRHDGPLDMRMGGDGATAADVVASASERDLADIIFALAEERRARAVARAIVAARREQPIATTAALATIVARVVHSRPGDIHPATRTFQALRLFVNDELRQLVEALAAAERLLRPGGRLVVVAFHSLEDRIVKSFLTERSAQDARSTASRHLPPTVSALATFEVLTRRPVTPDEAGIRANPRARSAKLRAAARTAVPARHDGPASISALLPRLPSLDSVLRGE